MSLFRYSITQKSSSIKNSICRKLSYARLNLKNKNKKNKIAWNSSFRKSSSMQKNFYKCDRSIFREPYSDLFKPYSDILKPYSGVFLQIFYKCDYLIFRVPYSCVFKPYSDVLKPYSSVFLQNFFISVVAVLWNSTSLKSSSMLLFFIYFFL